MVLGPALQGSPGQTWPCEEAVLAGACERSCIWGLAQGSAEVSLGVRAKEPAGQSGGGVGQGAAPEVPGSQPPANSEFLRHELGRASVSTPAHPLLPAWAPPSAGWDPHCLHSWAMLTPLCSSLTFVWPERGLWGKGSWRGGGCVLPFYHTRLAWIRRQLLLPFGLGGWGKKGSKAIPAWTGQPELSS